jgi:PBSX family phage portal protein
MAEPFVPEDEPQSSGARIARVVSFGGISKAASSTARDSDGLVMREFPSRQLTEDPFLNVSGYGNALRIPPYSFEQLVTLAEAHPIHAACIEQKVSDIIAGGPIFVPKRAHEDADPAQKQELEEWWESLTSDMTSLEVLQAMQTDYETLAWGMIEVARDTRGVVRQIYPVPAHTVRAHRSGRLFAQIRQGRQVWFKLWNESGNFYAKNGRPAPDGTPAQELANELLIFRKPSRRSTWYGIPTYISAVGHISLAIAARDYNVLWFSNAREPRLVIIVSGLAKDVDRTIDELEEQLREQHKDPHRNLLLPIEGDARVQIERITVQQNDLHFARMLSMMDEAVLTAHRVPPDRLGIARQGFLGGSIANVTNRIYKDGVVARGQDIIEDRLNRFVEVEFARYKAGGGIVGEPPPTPSQLAYKMDFEALDISDESVDASIVHQLVMLDLMTINEGRARLHMSYDDRFADLTLSEWLKANDLALPSSATRQSVVPDDGTAPPGPLPVPGAMTKALRDRIEQSLSRLDDVTEMLLMEEGFSMRGTNHH